MIFKTQESQDKTIKMKPSGNFRRSARFRWLELIIPALILGAGLGYWSLNARPVDSLQTAAPKPSTNFSLSTASHPSKIPASSSTSTNQGSSGNQQNIVTSDNSSSSSGSSNVSAQVNITSNNNNVQGQITTTVNGVSKTTNLSNTSFTSSSDGGSGTSTSHHFFCQVMTIHGPVNCGLAGYPSSNSDSSVVSYQLNDSSSSP